MAFYIGDQGYACEPVYYSNISWTTTKNVINAGRPLLSAIYKEQTGENFYHAVLILGYDSYQYQYTYSGRVNSEMYYYLRISDGWSSSSAGRYIDFNGFYRSVEAIDLIIGN